MSNTCFYFLPTWEDTYALKNVGDFCAILSSKYNVILILDSQPIDVPPYNYIVIPGHINGSASAFIRLFFCICIHRTKLIFSYCGYNSNLLIPFIHFMFRPQIFFKADSQSPQLHFPSFRSYVRYKLNLIAYSLSSLIIVESESLKSTFSRLLPNNEVRVFFNLKSRQTNVNEVSLSAASLPTPYLLFSGRLSYLKGIDQCISLLDFLRDTPINIVAVGPITDDFARSSISKAKNDAYLSQRFSHVEFISDYDQLLYYNKHAFASIITSRDEGLPNRIIDSISVGTPVISFDVGNVRSILNPTNSLIVNAGDIESFSSCVRHLLNESLIYSRLRSSTAASYSHILNSTHSITSLFADKL